MTQPTPTENDFESYLERLHLAIEGEQAGEVLIVLKEAEADDTAKLIDRLPPEDRQALFRLLTPEQGAEVLENVYYFQGADIIEEMAPDAAAPIIAELDSDDRADLLNELADANCHAILGEMDQAVADETRRFMAYPEGTAGALMYSEFVSFPVSMTVDEILNDIQSNHRRGGGHGFRIGNHFRTASLSRIARGQ